MGPGGGHAAAGGDGGAGGGASGEEGVAGGAGLWSGSTAPTGLDWVAGTSVAQPYRRHSEEGWEQRELSITEKLRWRVI